MDVERRTRNNEKRDEGIARELLTFTTERLPRYGWLLADAAVGKDPGRPHGEGKNQ